MTHRCTYRRKAFSLIELLMVISIIGMLVSLTVPAIRASRESGRRVQCLNNSRQIGLALHGYHGAKQELPPSRIGDGYLTWAALLLPYVEESTIGDQLDPAMNFFRQTEGVRLTPVKIYVCPSRARRNHVAGRKEGAGIKGDYAAVSSTFFLEAEKGQHFDGALLYGSSEVENPKAKPQRLKWWRSRTGFKDLTDGLSNTFLVLESSFWAAERASIYNGRDQPGAILGDEHYPAAHAAYKRKRKRPISNDWPPERHSWVGSAHPGVVVATMADGSCRPISKDADLIVLEKFVTRAGSETGDLAEVGGG